MDTREIYARCSAGFTRCVHTIGDRWSDPTPLPGWDVRDLVNHLVNEERWTPLLFGGATVDDVGDRLDGDLLGTDLARALHGDETLDPDVVAAVLDWFGDTETLYREIGVIGPRVDVPAAAGPQAQLLGRFGRRPI